MVNPAIKCETCPPIQPALSAAVTGPVEIDNKCNELGVPAILANYDLATPINLSFLNLDMTTGVHIPHQISEREGGRKSQYYLEVGETLLAGIITTQDGLMLRNVTRVTGSGPQANNGDIYREQWKSRTGEMIYEASGPLEILDPSKGKGKVVLTQTSTPQVAPPGATRSVSVWVLWSCIKVETESACSS